MRFVKAALALLFLTATAAAQAPSPGQLGVTHAADPEGVYVRDKTGTWVTLGSMEAGEFTPVSGGGTFVWPGTAGVGVGGQAPGAGTTMPYVNVLFQPDATVFTHRGPDPAAVVSGPLNVIDTGTTCAANPSSQLPCIGTPTAGSSFSVGVSQLGHLGVTAAISGGTISSGTVTMELSQDGITWYGRGLYLDSNPSPIWANGLTPPFAGVTEVGEYNFWRARVTGWAVSSGSPVLTITTRQGESANLVTIINLPTSAAGVNARAAVSVQGIIGGKPVIVSCPDGSCTGGGGGGSTAPFTPTGNTLASPLTPAAAAVSSVVAPTGGTSVLLSNTGTTVGYVRLTVGTGTATANDIPIQPGAGCALALGSNTWINVYGGAATGVSMNASAGNGQGDCPTGGGGGTATGGVGGQSLLSAPIAITSATATKLITGVAGKYTSITGFDATAAGAGTFQLVYGTGTTCATGRVIFTGAYSWTAQAGLNKVVGGGPSFIAPVNTDVCALTTTAIGYAGSIQYTQDTTPLLVGAGGGGGGGGGTFTWPGTATPDVGGATTPSTMPFVNAYFPDPPWNHTQSVAQPAVGAYGAPGPAYGASIGTNGAGGPFSPLIQEAGSVPLSFAAAATTQLIAAVSTKAIYITGWDILANGTGTGSLKFVYGTGVNCATGQQNLTGAYGLADGRGMVKTKMLFVPVNNALCSVVTVSGSIQMSGSLQDVQF